MQVFILTLVALTSVDLVPMPQEVDFDEDAFFEFAPTTPVIVSDLAVESDLAPVRDLLGAIGFDLPIIREADSVPGKPGFYIGDMLTHGAFGKRKLRKYLDDLDEPSSEGYRLVVNRDLVIVAGADPAGTAHGVRTLIQLLTEGGRIHCAEIRDEPDLPLRGVLVKGTPPSGLLKELAALKCNLVVFSSPDFCRLEGDAARKWKGVFAEARARHIRPVPMLRTDAVEGLLLPLIPQLSPGRKARQAAFKNLATLRPAAVLIAHTWPETILEDTLASSSTRAFGESVRMLADIAKASRPPVPLILLPEAKAGQEGAIRRAMSSIPKEVSLVIRSEASTSAPNFEAAIARATGKGHRCIALCEARPETAYAWCEALAASEGTAQGILVPIDEGGLRSEGLTVALRKAWSVATPKAVWPEGLNTYFQARLWLPGYDDVLGALAAYLDQQTLGQTDLKEEGKRFESVVKDLRKRLPEGEFELDLVESMYENLLTYQRIEEDFTREQSGALLNQLVKVVETQASLNPDSDPARVARITETISGKGLFVPSTILFGRHILPHRPMALPRGHVLLEIPATPTFRDTEHTAEATYDFLAAPGPVYRIDFETVGTAKLTVARSDDGETFRTLQAWTSKERGGVRGPALLHKRFLSRYVRVSVDAPAERAVLRHPRIFALKGPAVAVCRRTDVGIVLDAAFKERAWPLEAQVDGFVCADSQAFAEAQTTGRLCRNDDTLYVGLYAREPRMNTMGAKRRVHDDALWEEESLTIAIDTGKGGRYRFVVNPLGTRFESRNGDRTWNGEWQAAVREYPEGWSTEIAIPFVSLGGKPLRDRAWKVDFRRTRSNVKREVSAWAYPTHEEHAEDMGDVIFN